MLPYSGFMTKTIFEDRNDALHLFASLKQFNVHNLFGLLNQRSKQMCALEVILSSIPRVNEACLHAVDGKTAVSALFCKSGTWLW